MERKERESRLTRISKLMGSATLGGAGLGVGTSLMSSGANTIPKILKGGLLGGISSAILAGTAGTTGDLILGEPKEGERNAMARRGGMGGLAGGGLLGAGVGALAASGKLGSAVNQLKRSGKLGQALSSGLKGAVPERNLLVKQFKNLAAKPSRLGIAGGAGIGTVLGGLGSAFIGADEGMQADALAAELENARKRVR